MSKLYFLGKRLVTAGWNPPPGAAWITSPENPPTIQTRVFGAAGLAGELGLPADSVPDLSDPATLGCLLGALRRMLSCPEAVAVPRLGMSRDRADIIWSIEAPGFCVLADSEAAVLVRAYEALTPRFLPPPEFTARPRLGLPICKGRHGACREIATENGLCFPCYVQDCTS